MVAWFLWLTNPFKLFGSNRVKVLFSNVVCGFTGSPRATLHGQ